MPYLCFKMYSVFNKNTLVTLATKIYKNLVSYFLLLIRSSSLLDEQNKAIFLLLCFYVHSFALAHQCSVLHSFEQEQKLTSLFLIIFVGIANAVFLFQNVFCFLTKIRFVTLATKISKNFVVIFCFAYKKQQTA